MPTWEISCIFTVSAEQDPWRRAVGQFGYRQARKYRPSLRPIVTP